MGEHGLFRPNHIAYKYDIPQQLLKLRYKCAINIGLDL